MAEPIYHQPPRVPDAGSMAHWPGEAELPYDDGQPLPDSDFQLEPLGYMLYALRIHLEHRDDAAVQADMFVYYPAQGEDGRLVRRAVAPDIFVSFGVPNRKRLSYVVWEEGKPPDFVLEILSRSTWRRDVGEKKTIYEGMGIREYWTFDPTGDYQDPPLLGYRLVDRAFEPIEAVPGSLLKYDSAVLGLTLYVEDGVFRMKDPETGEYLLSPTELSEANRTAADARRWAEAARRREEAARHQADAARRREEAARHQADAARRREEAARHQAEAARRREEAARHQAEAERRRAEAARRREEAARHQAEAARHQEEAAHRATKTQLIEEAAVGRAAQARIARLEAQLRDRDKTPRDP